jgi:hypothetical protein
MTSPSTVSAKVATAAARFPRNCFLLQFRAAAENVFESGHTTVCLNSFSDRGDTSSVRYCSLPHMSTISSILQLIVVAVMVLRQQVIIVDGDEGVGRAVVTFVQFELVVCCVPLAAAICNR